MISSIKILLFSPFLKLFRWNESDNIVTKLPRYIHLYFDHYFYPEKLHGMLKKKKKKNTRLSFRTIIETIIVKKLRGEIHENSKPVDK